MNGSFQEAQTRRLFLLFACLPSAEKWEPLIQAAISQVQHSLRPGADPDDIRLCYYAAALANLRYRILIGAQGSISPTYAGAVSAERDDATPCSLAQRLADDYRANAADLLRDDAAFLLPT